MLQKPVYSFATHVFYMVTCKSFRIWFCYYYIGFTGKLNKKYPPKYFFNEQPVTIMYVNKNVNMELFIEYLFESYHAIYFFRLMRINQNFNEVRLI